MVAHLNYTDTKHFFIVNKINSSVIPGLAIYRVEDLRCKERL